jgi:hypothetical protein
MPMAKAEALFVDELKRVADAISADLSGRPALIATPTGNTAAPTLARMPQPTVAA